MMLLSIIVALIICLFLGMNFLRTIQSKLQDFWNFQKDKNHCVSLKEIISLEKITLLTISA
jgi:ABC-type sulfate transport system permease component